MERSPKNEKRDIIKEAETIVSDYISKIESQRTINTEKINKNIERKYKRLKYITLIFGITSILFAYILMINI